MRWQAFYVYFIAYDPIRINNALRKIRKEFFFSLCRVLLISNRRPKYHNYWFEYSKTNVNKTIPIAN